MSTISTQAESFQDTTPPSPRGTELAGEINWSMRKPDGATLTCALLDQGQWGVEIQVFRDGQFLFGRRLPDRSSAVVKADDLKTEHIRDGGVILP